MNGSRGIRTRSLSFAAVLVAAVVIPVAHRAGVAQADGALLPPAPTDVAAQSEDRAVSLFFTPVDGDAAVVSEYEARCFAASVVDAVAMANGEGTSTYFAALDAAASVRSLGVASPLLVTGLTAGSVYKCDVAAKNATGTGARSSMVRVSAGIVDSGEFVDPIAVPGFPESCNTPKVVVGNLGSVLVARQCYVGEWPNGSYHVMAAFRPVDAAFGSVIDVGSDVAVCPYNDFYGIISCAGRETVRPVFYGDGSAAVLFSQRIPGSTTPFSGQIALKEAVFLADGTSIPTRTLVDADRFDADGSFSLGRSINGDVAISWNARTDKRQMAFVSRIATDSDYSTVRLGPELVSYLSGYSAGTRDTLGFDSLGRAVAIGGHVNSADEPAQGYSLVRLDLATGETSATTPIDVTENWLRQVSFSDDEVAIVVAPLRLTSVGTRVVVVSLSTGSKLAEATVHEGLISDPITMAANSRGDTVVARMENALSGKYQLKALVRPAGGQFESDLVVADEIDNVGLWAWDDVSVDVDDDGYSTFAWAPLSNDGSRTAHVAVMEPASSVNTGSSAVARSSSQVRAKATPKIHTDISLPVGRTQGNGNLAVAARMGTVSAIGATSSKSSAVTWGSGFASRYRKIPTEPRALKISTWNQTARVSWSAPADDSGAIVRGYAVQISPDGLKWTTAVANEESTQYTVSGLRNGTKYWFRVLASGIYGTSNWSTIVGTPVASASAPVIRAVRTKGVTATITWSRPQFLASLVSSYRIQMSANGRRWTTVTSSVNRRALRYTVRGLKRKISYQFRVVPLNRKISGNPSDPSAPVKIK